MILVYHGDPALLHDYFNWVETTALSVWVREAVTVWSFPTILSLHTIGMGIVAGANTAVNLRILGIAPGVPLMEMKRFFPIMWFGFWLNAISGVLLLIGYPTKALTNPVFYTKLTFIAIAMAMVRSIGRRVFPDAAPPGDGRFLARASLACWAGAIIAGRLLAYTYRHLTSL